MPYVDPDQHNSRRRDEFAPDIRRILEVADGGTLLVEETPDGVILRNVAQSIARAQAIAREFGAGNHDRSVDAFLANRKAGSD